MSPSEPVLEVGAQFGARLLLERLGHPAAAAVPGRTFMAIDTRSLELEVISFRTGHQADLREFLESQRKLCRLDLPFATPLLSAGVSQGHAFTIAKRAMGFGLRAFRLGRRPSPELVSHIVWTTTAALASLHAAGFVHGDLHPRNVLVSLNGDVDVVGAFPPPLGGGAHTRVEEGQEIRWYLAPEVRGSARPTPASDLWALGLMALELYLGRSVLPETDQEGLRARQEKLVKVLPKVFEKSRRRFPRGMDAVLTSLLTLDPEARPRRAGAVLDRLLHVLPGPGSPGQVPAALRHELEVFARLVRRSLARKARKSAQVGQALPAAARLLRCVELLPEGQGSSRLSRLVRRVFWAVASTPYQNPGSRAAGFYLVQHVAERLGEPEVAQLASLGLRSCSDDLDAFRPFSATDATVREWELAVPTLLRSLRADPFDEIPLMALAIQGTPPEPGDDVDTYRARFLEGHGLLRQALFYQVRSLLKADTPSPRLVEIRRLADQIDEAPTGDEPLPDAHARKPSAAPPVVEADAVDELLSSAGLSVAPARPKPTSVPPDPSEKSAEGRGLSTLEVHGPEVLFLRAQVLVHEGQLGLAAGLLERLADEGYLQKERYARAIRQEVQKLLWRALSRSGGETVRETLTGIRKVADLAVRLHMDVVRPLCETLVIRVLDETKDPEGISRTVAELLMDAPDSIPWRQTAAICCLEEGDSLGWAGHLVAAAGALVDRHDLVAATKLLQAARRVQEAPGVSEVWARVVSLGEEVAEVSAKYRALLAEKPASQPEARLTSIDFFLEDYPWFEPAQLEVLALAESLHMTSRFTQAAMDLGRKHVLREEPERARARFHQVIRSDPTNDEAALYLASLRPPPAGFEGPIDLLRVGILQREELYDAARHYARKNLRGQQEDTPFLRALMEIAETLGEDPSPFYLSAGRLAIQRRDLAVARVLLISAMKLSSEREAMFHALLGTEAIGEIFTPLELDELRTESLAPA